MGKKNVHVVGKSNTIDIWNIEIKYTKKQKNYSKKTKQCFCLVVQIWINYWTFCDVYWSFLFLSVFFLYSIAVFL